MILKDRLVRSILWKLKSIKYIEVINETIEAINLFIKKSSLLIDTVNRLESKYDKTK